MRALFLLLASVTVAGCTSVSTPRSSRPILDGFSIPAPESPAPAVANANPESAAGVAPVGGHAEGPPAPQPIEPAPFDLRSFQAYPMETGQRGVHPRYAGIITALLGYRQFHDSSFWGDVDGQFAGFLEYCFRPNGSWLGLAVGAGGSYGSSSQTNQGIEQRLEAYTVEGYLGPKAYIEPARLPLQFYGGVGASFLYASGQVSTGSFSVVSDNDATFGVYGQLGAAYRLTSRDSVGLEYRGLFGTSINYRGNSGNADYSQLSMVFSHAF